MGSRQGGSGPNLTPQVDVRPYFANQPVVPCPTGTYVATLGRGPWGGEGKRRVPAADARRPPIVRR